MTLTQILSKLKSLVYSKTETDTLLGNKAASSHTHTKSQITDFPTIPTNTNQLTNGAGFITSSGSCSYANSAGNSDTLDSYHEYSFLRYRGNTSTSGEGTLWAQIGIKDYNNALPDGLSGVYQWGEVVSLAGGNGRFEIYCSHNSSNGNGLYYRSGWANDKKDWRLFIDSANIGSQSVNYANSAGSAGSVAWSNVSGRPTAVSQFTNDSGYITSAVKESSYDDNRKYCLLHGDLLIQFGTNVFSAQSGNVTFKKAFSSAPIVNVNYGDDVGFGSPCCLDEAYTTYFTAKNAADSELWRCNWIAIGRA